MMYMKKYVQIFILAVVCIGGFGAWYLFAGQPAGIPDSPAFSAAVSSSTSARIDVSPVPPAGYAEYRNARYHFVLFYPKDLRVQTYGGTGSDLTVTFQDPSTGEGFQIYAFPYNEPQISGARFRADEPSGVMEQATDIFIGGVQGTMFFGRDATLGDTREVWFIHGGVLYEVATYKALDEWLSNIMRTWRFLP